MNPQVAQHRVSSAAILPSPEKDSRTRPEFSRAYRAEKRENSRRAWLFGDAVGHCLTVAFRADSGIGTRFMERRATRRDSTSIIETSPVLMSRRDFLKTAPRLHGQSRSGIGAHRSGKILVLCADISRNVIMARRAGHN